VINERNQNKLSSKRRHQLAPAVLITDQAQSSNDDGHIVNEFFRGML